MRFMWGQGAKGLWIGALLGGLEGLWVAFSSLEGWILFPGDMILCGIILCGGLGFLMGDTFFEWLKEWWSVWFGPGP